MGDWIRSKYGDQDVLAGKLGVSRASVSAYKTGRVEIPPKVKDAIRKLGYDGPWPREEAQEAPAPAGGPYATASEVAELRGAVKAHIDYWREGEGAKKECTYDTRCDLATFEKENSIFCAADRGRYNRCLRGEE